MKKRVWVIKLLNYEYWPMWTFYLPLLPYFLIKGIANGQLFYFTNANPGMDEYGGFFTDSKFHIDQLIPEKYKPFTFQIRPFESPEAIKTGLKKMNLRYPVILKPDSGERGAGVVKVKDEGRLTELIKGIKKPHLIQEYIDHPIEYGVFIAFIPETKSFKVTSITEKKYFEVIGDGVKSIKELILLKDRGVVFFEKLKARSEYQMDHIPAKNEICVIHALGNHCNGTEFINRSGLKSIELDKSFTVFLQSLEGIKYGRFDIKVKNFDDLLTFENFKIIEFNGVAAEPLHIYDSTLGYIRALKSFIAHWRLLNNISIYNKKRGYKGVNFKKVINKIRTRGN